ncbi:MAG: SDR family oxidoreductase [Pseudonocardia sp.]|nr:SDR family oxidoreductase [Pseudonocardia sp.]
MSGVAVVSGGAGGIGRGLVTALTKLGAEVAVLDLAANETAALSVVCDVTDREAVRAAANKIESELGSPAKIVCAAGVVSEVALTDLPEDEWRRVVDASLTSAFLLTQAMLPSMIRAGGGSIVMMSSGWGRKGYPLGAHYAAAKAGVEALTKSIALEYAGRGVRCNAIAPGPVRTTMISNNPTFDEDERAALIPMGRIGEVDDVVAPVLFLLGGGARYITGQVLHVNGGMLMP